MDSNSVSPMPELAPMAEFDKTPPTPPEETLPLDDLPPPPTTVTVQDEKKEEEHRHYEEENEWGCGSWFEYTLVVVLASILLLGAVALTIFWVVQYRGGFGWNANEPDKQFNLHPVLMIAGFITFSGFSILLYRICRCCRRIYVKLLHTVFHAIAIPCVVIGFLAVFEYHNNDKKKIPNFYSMHSWIGLVTMGLFAIQFVVGFFSFLVLLCCEGATSAFRASLVPIHASFGLTTFMLAIAASLTGLTEKAFFSIGNYTRLPKEGIVVNTIATVLVAIGIIIHYILQREEFRFRAHVLIRSGDGIDEYTKWIPEGIVVNALAMVLVALGILVSYAVRSQVLRVDTKVYVTERL